MFKEQGEDLLDWRIVNEGRLAVAWKDRQGLDHNKEFGFCSVCSWSPLGR